MRGVRLRLLPRRLSGVLDLYGAPSDPQRAEGDLK